MPIELQPVIEFIVKGQQPDGGFATWERYPVIDPHGDWQILPDPSPFVTANIAYSLLAIKNPALKPCINNAAKFLLSRMEARGYWRFWPLTKRQHALPFDMDDTAVSSFVLSSCGHSLNNKSVLAANKNSSGYYYTWLIPSTGLLLKRPATWLSFLKACIDGLATRYVNFYAYTDCEPGVAANAILYLGENAGTKPCINAIIEEVKNGSFRMQFYHHQIMVYYHIARTYANGVKGFEVVGGVICERVKSLFAQSINDKDELLRLMAAIILLHYKNDVALAEKLIQSVKEGGMYPGNWGIVPYFSSENRNFLAGSPQFTAAVFLEAVNLLNANRI